MVSPPIKTGSVFPKNIRVSKTAKTVPKMARMINIWNRFTGGHFLLKNIIPSDAVFNLY
jgi:hypothetical protein